MAYIMQEYDNALRLILEKGVWKKNERTKSRCLSYFGITSRFPLTDHFPLITRRKIYPKAIFAELLWFISGSTNVKDLEKLGSKIWTPWRDEKFEKEHGYAEGCLGPVYGFNLRYFGGQYGNGIGGLANTTDDYFVHYERPYPSKTNYYGVGGFDQLKYMMRRIKEDPSCRRIMFSLWNPAVIEYSRLPPCHFCYQVFIDDEGNLSGMMTMRSTDYPIGAVANIQFYSALTMMIAKQTGYKAKEFVLSTADSHIYSDQIDAVKEYLERPFGHSPRIEINKAKDIFSYTMDDFKVIDYNPEPPIKIPVAI